MWKKFLAVMATMAVLSTSVSALVLNPKIDVDGNDIPNYIDNFDVNPSAPFDPTAGPATISFDLNYDANIYVYAINMTTSDPYEIVGTSSAYVPETTASSPINYTWYGRVGNTAAGALLPDGTYEVKVFAQDGTTLMDSAKEEIILDSSYQPPGPQVTDLKADPVTFSATGDEDTEISFDVDKNAYLTVVVKNAAGNTVKTFADYTGNKWYQSSEIHSINWDGTNDAGNKVAEAFYTVSVTAKDADDNENTFTTTVEVKTTSIVSDGVIEDFELDPSNTWDPTDEELEISFELTDDVDSLIIEAKKGNKVIEIYDDEDLDDDDYTEPWDGTDDDDDYVDEGVWEITVRADGDKVVLFIEVEYEKPEITTAFVTKEEFDPSEDEFTNLVFKVDAPAIVTVDVYKGSKKEFTLLDEEEVRKNRYYVVQWDGMDEDGDEVDFGKDWKFKITAENLIDDDIYSTETVEVDVEEDDVSSNKANILNDYTDPVVFDEDNSMEFSYCVDEDAEIFLAIYKGKSTSGNAEIELLDYVEQDEGCHTVKWNGEDEDNKDLKDGIYSYKLISKVNSYKETEVGRFVVGNAGDDDYDDDDDDDDDDDYYYDGDVFGTCTLYYWDLTYMEEDNELCEAITWVTNEAIFNGYDDGTFRPYDLINRAEVLRVVLEAFDVPLFSINGGTEGFTDVDPYAWYMPYVRTAKFYGMLHGYGDGTARLVNKINRVELLKFVLEASDEFTSYEGLSTGFYGSEDYADVDPADSDTAWFYNYANTAYEYELYNTYFINGQEYLNPSRLVERGEVALLFYRMHKAGLM